MLRLAEGLLGRGLAVDFVVGQAKGELLREVPAGARIVPLAETPIFWAQAQARLLVTQPGAWRFMLKRRHKIRVVKPLLRWTPCMIDYLRRARPDAVLTAEPRYNLLAVWGRRHSGLSGRVVITEHIQVSRHAASENWWTDASLRDPLRGAYLKADAIVAVSDGVADDLAARARIPRERITTVYNPVVGPDLVAKARERPNHPWFAPGEPPVVLAVGRLEPQKDFATLIRAFAQVRQRRPARLMILGAANPGNLAYAEELKALPDALGIAADVALPGFVANPFPYMAHASIFVLSSHYEGLPTVLIEALACGTPVASTDCPSGPREILDHGQYGPLVPVGDDAALARAIEDTLDDPPAGESLRARAGLFTVERAVDSYLKLLFPGAPRDSLSKSPYVSHSRPHGSVEDGSMPDDQGPEPKPPASEDAAYGLLVAPTHNIGDEIQSLAQRQFLPQVDYFVNRERLHQPDEQLPRDRRIRLIMNGWFLHNVSQWPPNEIFEPVFISFHADNPDLVSFRYRHYYKKYEPIGCRDEYTRDLFRNIGVDAYVSYCLTLTLQNLSSQRGDQVYVVDAHVQHPHRYPPTAPELLNLIPRDVLERAEYLEHELPHVLDRFNYSQKRERAEKLIRAYSAAKFVITTRLHCALPCLALGTPVIFLHRGLYTDPRFTGYHEYLYGYTSTSDVMDFNFDNPKPKKDIRPIRDRLIQDLARHGYSLRG
jgi:glycosyltransferase involved in cell wall biosynthesis